MENYCVSNSIIELAIGCFATSYHLQYRYLPRTQHISNFWVDYKELKFWIDCCNQVKAGICSRWWTFVFEGQRPHAPTVFCQTYWNQLRLKPVPKSLPPWNTPLDPLQSSGLRLDQLDLFILGPPQKMASCPTAEARAYGSAGGIRWRLQSLQTRRTAGGARWYWTFEEWKSPEPWPQG